MSRLKQIDKLLSIKELRRRLAEMEAARSRRVVQEADAMLQEAHDEEAYIKETSAQRRQERLKQVVEAGKNPAVQNAQLVNVYAITSQEISGAKFNTELKRQQVDEANERLKLEQKKLARFLQIEERTRKLCDRLIDMKKVEAARQA